VHFVGFYNKNIFRYYYFRYICAPHNMRQREIFMGTATILKQFSHFTFTPFCI